MSLYDYQSPIEMIAMEMRKQYENNCVSICQSYGFKVDKDELAKALAYDRNQYDKGFKDGYNQALLERHACKWIPVSERLPEGKIDSNTRDFEGVLCTTIWGDVRAYKFGKAIGHDKPHFWLYGEIKDEYVIAWQPLPEPYQKGGAE